MGEQFVFAEIATVAGIGHVAGVIEFLGVNHTDGKMEPFGDSKGVIFVVDAKTEDEARAIMGTLPLAKEHLMDDQYIPVGPLLPLRSLMGPGAQQ